MLPYLNIGLFGVPTAPLVIVLAMWLSLYVVDRAARRLGQDPEKLYGLASAGLISSFIGARLVFVALHWPAFADYPLGIVWPLTIGYNVAGGAFIGAATMFFLGRAMRLSLWPVLDALVPGLLLFLMGMSLAGFLGGAGYGSLTSMPWGINYYGVRRHAVQLYEMGAGLAALGAWWVVTLPRFRGADGRPFLIATAVYAAGRLFVDAYNGTATLVGGGFHLGQIVALVVVLAALVILWRLSWEQGFVQVGE